MLLFICLTLFNHAVPLQSLRYCRLQSNPHDILRVLKHASKLKQKRPVSSNERSIFPEEIQDQECYLSCDPMNGLLSISALLDRLPLFSHFPFQSNIECLYIFPPPPTFNRKHILFPQNTKRRRRKRFKQNSRISIYIQLAKYIQLKIARAERKGKKEECFNSKVKPQLMTSGDRSQVDKQSITVLNI